MASIIRSPDMSDETRKLTTRRGRSVAQAISAAYPTPVQHEAAAPINEVATAPVHQNLAVPAAAPVKQRAPEPDVKALVEQARQSVLEQFKADAEKARELGRQRGLQEGRQSGAEESRKAFAAELARLRSIADSLNHALETQIQGVEEIAVSIAFEAMCRVLGDSAVTREGITAIVRQAASHAVNTEKVVARLHPGDLSFLRDAGGLDPSLSSGMAVSWVADESVVLGGCILETEHGELDARLETQMDRLRTTLLAARRAKP